MKGVIQPSDHFQDFLQDACEFLEDTLSKEKLSRTAMEHRTRLMAKMSGLMKDQLRPPSVDMYIDMNSHPTLRAFFTSDSSTSGTDTSSIQGKYEGNEEIYDEAAHLDEPDGGQAIYNETAEAPQQPAAPEPPPPPPPLKSNKTFLSMFMKTMGRSKMPKPPPKQEDATYDDAAVTREEPIYDDASVLKHSDQQIIYDDVNCSQQEFYDIRASPECKEDPEVPVKDADAVSIKSGLSESSIISTGTVGLGGTTWSISAKEAQAQAIMSGIVKRRDCRKLLSAWRSSLAVLLPSQLLFFSTEADGKPKAVLDLAPDIRVRRAISSKQQAGDAKRVKMQPFLIDLDGKLLYEVSTKSRLETEAWITAIQSATSSRVPDVIPSRQQHMEETDDARSADENTDVDEDDDNIYEDLENFQQQTAQHQQPAEDVPEARNSGIRSRLSFFRFKRTSTQSEGSAKRHSVYSTSKEEEIYHDPTSPMGSKNATPYDSVESLEHNRETAEVYNSLDRQTVEAPAGFGELIKNMRSTLKSASSGHVRSQSLGPIPNAEESDPPGAVYDTPSPTVRPLGPTKEVNSFASLILQNQVKVMRRLSDSQNGEVQHYDVPTSNQKIADQLVEEAATYDLVASPPRAVVATPVVVEAPKAKKMAQFWQEKVSIQTDKAKSLLKPSLTKETAAIKETQSVGRSFGRGPQRMPLVAVPENSDKPASVAQVIASFKSANQKNQPVSLSSFGPLSNAVSNKKDPPPRPPAPLVSKGPQIPSKNAPEDTKLTTNKLHTARWAYVAQNPLELSLNKGEVVQVMNPAGPSWLVRSTRNNKKGLVPREYLVAN